MPNASKIDIWFEDFTVGQSQTTGAYLITREEVIAFASEFDFQPMHLDEDAALESMVGEFMASGWHTASIMMRLLYDGLISRSSCQGSPSMDVMNWKAPVRVGDVLNLNWTVTAKRRLKSRPESGMVHFDLLVADANGEIKLSGTQPVMFGLRDPASALPEDAGNG